MVTVQVQGQADVIYEHVTPETARAIVAEQAGQPADPQSKPALAEHVLPATSPSSPSSRRSCWPTAG